LEKSGLKALQDVPHKHSHSPQLKIKKHGRTKRTSPRGECSVVNGDIEILQGFQFNINAVLDTTFFAPFTAALDCVSMVGVLEPHSQICS